MPSTVQADDNSSPRRTIQFKASSSSPIMSSSSKHKNNSTTSKGKHATTPARRVMPVNTFMSPAAIAMEALLARMDAEEGDDGSTPTSLLHKKNTTPATAHPVTPQMGPTPINGPTSKSNSKSTGTKISVDVSKRILYNSAEEDEMNNGGGDIVESGAADASSDGAVEPIVMVTQEVYRSTAVNTSSGWRQSKRSSKGGSSSTVSASTRPLDINQKEAIDAREQLDRVTKQLQLWASSTQAPLYFKPRSTPVKPPVVEDNTAPDAECKTVAPTTAPIPTSTTTALAEDGASHSPPRECSPVADAEQSQQEGVTAPVEQVGGDDQDDAKILAAALRMSESGPGCVVAEPSETPAVTAMTAPPQSSTVAEKDDVQSTEAASVSARVTSQPIEDALSSILSGNVGEVFPIICYNGVHLGSLSPSHADAVHRRIEESTGDKLRRPLDVEEFHLYLYVLPVHRAAWLGDSVSTTTTTSAYGHLYEIPHIDILLQVLRSPHCRKVILDGQGFLYPLLLALLGSEGVGDIVNVVDLRVADYVLPETYNHQSSTQLQQATTSPSSYAVPGSVEWIIRGVESELIQPLRSLYTFIGTSYCVPVENEADTPNADEPTVSSPPSSRPFGPQAQLFANLMQESSVAYCCALMEFNGLVLNAHEAIQTLQLLQQRSNAIHTLIDEIVSAARIECGLMVSSSSLPSAASTSAGSPRRAAAAGDSSEESRQYILSRRRLHTPEDRVHAILAMPSSLISNTPATLSTPLLRQPHPQESAPSSTISDLEILPRHQLSLSPQDNLLLTQQTHEYGGARQYIISLLSAMAPTVGTEISSVFRAQLRTDSVLLWHCPVAALWAELCEVKDAGSKLQQLLKKHQGRIAAKMELARSGVVSSTSNPSASGADYRANNLLLDLHPSYNADSSTGRIFSSNPNVQTIPTAEYLIGTTASHSEGEGAADAANNDSCSFTPGQIALLNRVWREIKEKRKSASTRAAAAAAEAENNIIVVDDEDDSTKPAALKTRRIQVVEEENVVVVSGKATIFRASQSQDETTNNNSDKNGTSQSSSLSGSAEGMYLSEIPPMLHPQRVSIKRFYRGSCVQKDNNGIQYHSVIISLDYNQIELRMLAHHSQDPNLLRAFVSTASNVGTESAEDSEVATTPTPTPDSKKGSKKTKKATKKQRKDAEVETKELTTTSQEDTSKPVSDVLRLMASLMFGLSNPDAVTPQQRQAAKVVTYGLMYGLGDAALQARLPSSLSSASSTPSTTQQSAAETTPPPPASPRPSSGSEQVPIEKLCPAHLLDELTQEGPTSTPTHPALQEQQAAESESVVVADAPPTPSPPRPSPPQAQPVTAASVRAAFRNAFPQACSYLEHLASTAVVTGEVRTLGGRRRHFERPTDSITVGGIGGKRSRGDEGNSAWSIGTKAVATVIQGSAADVLKGAMVACVRAISASSALQGRCRLVSSIHDELLFNLHISTSGNKDDDDILHSAILTLKRCMEQQATHFHLSVPLTVSTKVGTSLGSLKKEQQ